MFSVCTNKMGNVNAYSEYRLKKREKIMHMNKSSNNLFLSSFVVKYTHTKSF